MIPDNLQKPPIIYTYIIQMSDQPHNDTSCANYQLISFIPHLMSEVNTRIGKDCHACW